MYSNIGVAIRRGGGDEQSLYVNSVPLGRRSRGSGGASPGRLSRSQLDGKTLDAEVVGELADGRQAGPGTHRFASRAHRHQAQRRTRWPPVGSPVYGVVVSSATQKGPRTWLRCGGLLNENAVTRNAD